MAKKASLFHYLGLHLTAFPTEGLELRLYTPLFAVELSFFSKCVMYYARSLGIRLAFWPAFPKEGYGLYRFNRFFGWRFSEELLRAIDWRFEKFFHAPRCKYCKKKITDFRSKPFAPRSEWQHARCANALRMYSEESKKMLSSVDFWNPPL